MSTLPVLKNLLLFAILAVLGVWGWKHFTAEPPPPQTPEEAVAAFVQQSVLPAADLAVLCEKHPKLVTQALKGKRVAISGVLVRALVLGINSNDLKLELAGAPKLKISFQSDFGRKERWGAPAGFRFQKSGKEILILSVAKPASSAESDKNASDRVYPQIDTSNEAAALQSMTGAIAKAFSSSGGNKKTASAQSPTAPVQQVLCREGNTLTLRGEFHRIGPGWVKCDLLELP